MKNLEIQKTIEKKTLFLNQNHKKPGKYQKKIRIVLDF